MDGDMTGVVPGSLSPSTSTTSPGPGAGSGAEESGAAGRRKNAVARRMSSLFGLLDPAAMELDREAKRAAQADLRVMIERLGKYRTDLTETERQEFDGKNQTYFILYSNNVINQ
jgi:hypothetical protein